MRRSGLGSLERQSAHAQAFRIDDAGHVSIAPSDHSIVSVEPFSPTSIRTGTSKAWPDYR